MEITEVRIKKYEGEGKTVAFASVTFDEALVVKDMRVINGSEGLFVTFPQKKSGDKYHDIVFPLNKEFRSKVQDAVLVKYNEEG